MEMIIFSQVFLDEPLSIEVEEPSTQEDLFLNEYQYIEEESDEPQMNAPSSELKFYFYQSDGVITIATTRLCKRNRIFTKPTISLPQYDEVDYKVKGRSYKQRIPLCRGGRK